VSALDRNLIPAQALWRLGTEEPTELGLPALIAAPVEEDGEQWAIIVGFYFWSADGWENEESGEILKLTYFWWISENELVAGLVAVPQPKTITSRGLQ
jgi:hypothetical protein